MKGKIGLLFVFLFGFVQFGQAQALPFVKSPQSQKEFATAIRTNDARVLNLGCDKIYKVANETFKSKFKSCEDLADHIEQLKLVPCPKVTTTLGRVLKNGTVDMVGWKRELRDKEMCLGSTIDNRFRIEYSLDCGNTIPNLWLEKTPPQAILNSRPYVLPVIQAPAVSVNRSGVTVAVVASSPSTVAIIRPATTSVPAQPVVETAKVPDVSSAPAQSLATGSVQGATIDGKGVIINNNITIQVVPSVQDEPVAQPKSRGAGPESNSDVKSARNGNRLFGSRWSGRFTNTFYNLPTERNRKNFIDNYSLSEDFRLLSFGSRTQVRAVGSLDGLSARQDTKALPWDQYVTPSMGVHMVTTFFNQNVLGTIDVSGRFACELRGDGLGLPTRTRCAPLASVLATVKWEQSIPFQRMPGTLSVRVGTVTPYERNNVVTEVQLEQGYVAYRYRALSVVPQMAGTIGSDTKLFPWRNRFSAGVGPRLGISTKLGNLDIIPMFETADQYRAKRALFVKGSGFSVHVRFQRSWGNS